jgi:hypothetical protein
LDENLIRRPLPNSATYFTWEDSWDSVVWVTDATLGTLMVGPPLVPKPGVVLIKLESRPEVYAVEESIDGQKILRHIPSEDLARQYFGERWMDYVLDVPPTIFPHYQQGEGVVRGEPWNLDGMKVRDDLR